MGRLWQDTKRLILGIDNSENTPLDFKEEILNSINNNVIDKAKASLLITARNTTDKLGKLIDKKQINDVSGKGQRVSIQEDNKNIEKITENRKVKTKKEIEEKEEKEKKEQSLRQTLQQIVEKDEKEIENKLNKNKD